MRELEPGTTFAGHRIESVAGRGGMGIVYRATHLALDHLIALKVISPELAADDVFRRRFARESRAAVSIRHPNVIAIHHAGEEQGLLFVTMDLIEGSDLRRLLRAHDRLDALRAVALAEQVAAALDAAHERGLVHRDVKPANVLIEPRAGAEHVYLSDFGLTKPIGADSDVTQSGAFVGTLDYVAPEQIRGERVDARTDVYALGCVLFEMLAGQAPFASRGEKLAKIYAHLEDDPPPLRIGVRHTPEPLGEVVGRALAKRADDRFASAGDLARAARAAVEGRAAPTEERSVATGLAAPTSEQALPIVDESTVESPLARPSNGPDRDRAGAAAVPPAEAATQPAAAGPTRATAAEGVLRRRLRPALLATALVAIAAVLWLLVIDGDPEPQLAAGAQAELLGDPVPVGANAVGAASGAGSVWVSGRDSGTVERLDPETGEVVSRIEVGGAPVQIAFGGGALWVALGEANAAARINPGPEPGAERAEIFPAGTDPRGIAAGEGSVWVANSEDATVTRLDPESGATIETIAVGAYPRRVTVAEGFAWVANRDSSSVSRIDPGGGSAREIEVAGEPKSIAAAGGLVWVAERAAGSVAAIDPERGEVVGRVEEVGDRPQGAAGAFGALWVANAGGTVVRIDPGAERIAESIETGPRPEEIAVAGGLLWVTLGDADGVARIEP